MPDSRTDPRNTLPPLTRLLMVAETIEELFSDDADVLCEVHAELTAELERLRAIEQRAAEVFAGDIDQPVGVIGRATARYILGNPGGCPDHWVLGEGNDRVAVPVFGCAACQTVVSARPGAAAEREG